MLAPFIMEDLENFTHKLQKLLDTHEKNIDKLAKSDSTSFEDIAKPLQEMDEELSLFFTPLVHLNSVSNSKKTQLVYDESLPLISAFETKLAHHKPLYEKIKQLSTTTLEEEKVKQDMIKEFELSGIALPKSKQEEIESIEVRLSDLSNQFSRNLLEATNEFCLDITDPKDIEGLPQNDIAQAKVPNEPSLYRFTLQMPSYIAYMTYGPNREYRERLYRAYTTRAPQNSDIIDEILYLRRKKASLLGCKSYAEYALKKRDASSYDEVIKFLEEILFSAREFALQEMDQLRLFAKETDGIEDLASYDVAYYSQKLKKELFDFDETMTQPYFEQQRVLNGMLEVVSELFDVDFKAVNVEVWHDCVKTYDIYENGVQVGRIYFDLEARKEKKGGAWMHDFSTHFIDTKGTTHFASAFIVCNFSPTTQESPSLLRHDDVVTLFHEMGHALHHLFGKSTQRPLSGINGVAWDVVEFPSQFFENFAYTKDIIKRFGFHYQTKEPIPKWLVDKIVASKNFHAALGILRQVEFALFDLMLHQKEYKGQEIQTLLDTIRQTTAPLTPPSYNRFQNGFGHIFAGGYAAGYYSYKWAEVLSADAFFACLDENQTFDKSKAKGYKENILSQGSKKEMRVLY
ncbi:MAG TPA: M3 family peptidase, partial [Epsilonproteobacteria bacterium]|nr:M3 family peptidase [Campylobacterota bacterium]